MNTFFQTYFDEKQLDDQVYEVESTGNSIFGTTHLIPTAAVIDRIKCTRGKEAKAIEMTIRKIDCLNGDLHHYLKHLAQAMADQF